MSSPPMTPIDFSAHLAKQIGFLTRSCMAFDAGYHDEAIRIATVVRILVHQTKNSTSLLKHLNATTINLLSTTEGAGPGTLYAMSMGTVSISSDGTSAYYPSLGDGMHKALIPVSKWWDQIIIVSGQLRLSRRKIVLGAADKDGGAHIDSSLSPDYKELTEQGFAGSVFYNSCGEDSVRKLENTHLVCLRQIGYELLNSPQLLQLVGASPSIERNSPRQAGSSLSCQVDL